MNQIKKILTVAIFSSISTLSVADPILNQTSSVTENASVVKAPNSLPVQTSPLPAQTTNNGHDAASEKELPYLDPAKYDEKYKGVLQLLNQAQLSEGEYLGLKRIVETNKEYPALETGILYFTVLHEKDDADYKKAIYWLGTSSVQEKNSTADLILGSMYLEGKGVEKSFEKALSFYQRAAERGNDSAKLILAGTYLFNSYVKDEVKGNMWLDSLASSNNKYAILLKNLMSLKPEDKQLYVKFIEPYFSYAKEGDEMAQFTLGYLYYSGKIVDKDIEEANSYLKQSSIKGNPISIILFQETLKEIKENDKK